MNNHKPARTLQDELSESTISFPLPSLPGLLLSVGDSYKLAVTCTRRDALDAWSPDKDPSCDQPTVGCKETS